jgi:hypothetical protein
MVKRLVPYFVVAIATAVLTTLFQPLSHMKSLAQSLPQAQGQQANQQARCTTFEETGKTVCGRFLEYWHANGGLAQQGFPISDTFVEVSELNGLPYTVQYFERAVFELHPENAPPYDVLLSQLGKFRMEQEYPGGIPTPTAGAPGSISGRLTYPGEMVPAVKVYAIEAVGSRYFSVQTKEGDQIFTIDNVAPGTYYVLAYWSADLDRPGAYSRFVDCGLTVTCTDRSLIPVTVQPGQAVQGVRVEDWYSPPGTFPLPPDLADRPLLYMWPRQLPAGLAIRKDRSSADTSRFTLELYTPSNAQFTGAVIGGPGSIAASPPAVVTERGTRVTVRGLPATLFTTGAGYSLFWSEADQGYAITGSLPRDTVLALAEQLEPVDLAAWRARLAAVR